MTEIITSHPGRVSHRIHKQGQEVDIELRKMLKISKYKKNNQTFLALTFLFFFLQKFDV